MGINVENTIKELQELATQHEKVAVAFSGGKDSLITLDLALRFFKNVYPFYMYFVPGLEFDEKRMAYCKQRFNLDVLLYPHFITFECLKTNTYIDPHPEVDEFPDLNQRMIYDWVKHETGSTLILNGQKKADGAFRRRLIATTKNTQKDIYRPLKDWLRWEVLSYLKARDIPLPQQAGADNSGISLSTDEILYMYDNNQHDYEIIKSYFPYVETIIVRRELFGRTDG